MGLLDVRERKEGRRKNKNKKEERKGERKTWRDESDGREEIFYWCVKGKNKLKFKT
jgi:hypothetical protein